MISSSTKPCGQLRRQTAHSWRGRTGRLRESVTRLADRARGEGWSHEEFLVACLQREVAAREAHGGEGRIRADRFPARKSLEEFDFDHARGLSGKSSRIWAPWTSSRARRTWCSSAHPLSAGLERVSSLFVTSVTRVDLRR
jgi:IstB-like ATP binding protein